MEIMMILEYSFCCSTDGDQEVTRLKWKLLECKTYRMGILTVVVDQSSPDESTNYYFIVGMFYDL